MIPDPDSDVQRALALLEQKKPTRICKSCRSAECWLGGVTERYAFGSPQRPVYPIKTIDIVYDEDDVLRWRWNYIADAGYRLVLPWSPRRPKDPPGFTILEPPLTIGLPERAVRATMVHT